jgi:hypothetical protein
MTDTPRTDAEVFPIQDCNGQLRRVITTQFAKQLERELAISLENQCKAQSEVERLSKLTEDCLSVLRVYCPRYYQDAMERFNASSDNHPLQCQ